MMLYFVKFEFYHNNEISINNRSVCVRYLFVLSEEIGKKKSANRPRIEKSGGGGTSRQENAIEVSCDS
jgi:hypothetical protein